MQLKYQHETGTVQSVEKEFGDIINMNKREKAFEESSGNDFVFIVILSGAIAYLSMNLFFGFSLIDMFYMETFEMYMDATLELVVCFVLQLNIILYYLTEKWKIEDYE